MFEKRKLKKRIKQLNKEIENGNLQSMYDLAMIYLDGTIIKKDEKAAVSLLQTAADAGHIQSKTYLISKKLSDSAVIGAKAISDIQSLFKK
ncbi:MAG: SEL1-like repeat protein [Clostridia bacterium]|nr:SEL1-like repeat protein [Clostridia bacterium]